MKMIKIWSHWSELKKWSELTGVETFCQCDRIDEVSPAENANDLRVQVAQADLLQHFEESEKKKKNAGSKICRKVFFAVWRQTLLRLWWHFGSHGREFDSFGRGHRFESIKCTKNFICRVMRLFRRPFNFSVVSGHFYRTGTIAQ